MKCITTSIYFLLITISTTVMAKQLSAVPIKILFGSCLHQDKPQPIWAAMNQEQGDLFVLLGDNVYGDTEDMAELKAIYAKQWSKSGMQTMLANTPTIGMWDDHDFATWLTPVISFQYFNFLTMKKYFFILRLP